MAVMELLVPILFFFGSFLEPVDLDIDIEGNIYVVDAGRDLVIKYSTLGDSLDAVGGFGVGTEDFDRPVALYARRGTDVYVADYNNHRIQRFDRRLDYVTTLYTRESPEEEIRFGYPLDVAVSRQGDILVLDGENRRVAVFDASGRFVRAFGDITSGEGQLTDPAKLELDSRDNVYVLDQGTIVIYDPFGAWLRTIPLPERTTHYDFAVEGDSLAILADSLLFFYRPEERQRGKTIMIEDVQAPRAIRSHGGFLYVIESDRIDVRKLPAAGADTLQEE